MWLLWHKVLYIKVIYFSIYNNYQVCEDEPAQSSVKGYSYKDAVVLA